MKKILLIILCLSLAGNAFAKEEKTIRRLDTFKERIVGSFVKTFAKTYIATCNLEKFKEKNIKKIRKMDEAKFQRVYGKVYQEVMIDLPQSLKMTWGISENMTREKAIAQLKSFTNKKQIYKLINSIPNQMIAKHFEKHKNEFNKTMKKDGSGVDAAVDQLLSDPGVSS